MMSSVWAWNPRHTMRRILAPGALGAVLTLTCLPGIAEVAPAELVNGADSSATAYNFYVGNLHAHTKYSDGCGTPAQAFAHARDVADIDFLAITDHHNALTPAEYADVLYQADLYDEPGLFVAIAGQEWSGIYNPSHANIFQADHVFTAPEGDFDSLYSELVLSGCTANFNHPNAGDFDDFAYSAAGDVGINAVEVRREGEQAMYVKVLNRGWHVGADGSQDNHECDWGDGRAWTVALACSLSRGAILDAQRNHRTYSTLDRHLRVVFKAAGHWMGDTFSHTGTVPFWIDVCDSGQSESLTSIELYQNGYVVAWCAPDTNCTTWCPEISPPDSVAHYFVKVREADGDRAWTSPVWIDGDGVLPSTPALCSPKNGEDIDRLMPVLSWHPSDRTTSYTLEYSWSPGFTEGPSTVTVEGLCDTSYAVAGGLTPYRTYYWRVAAVNGHGSAWSWPARFSADLDVFPGASETPLVGGPSYDDYPCLLQASPDVWLFWTSTRDGDPEIYCKSSADGGQTWRIPRRLTSCAGSDLTPCAAEDGMGQIWLVWQTNRDGNAEIYWQTYWGLMWSEEVNLTQHPGSDTAPAVAVSPDSVVWVVWASDRDGADTEIYCSRWDGTSWSDPDRLTDNQFEDTDPEVAESASGEIWVVWTSDRDGEPDIYFKRFGAGAWSEDARLTWSDESETQPSVETPADGAVWIAYVRTNRVYFKVFRDWVWSDEMVLPPTPSNQGRPSEMAAADGRLWVAYSSARSGNTGIYAQITKCSVSTGIAGPPRGIGPEAVPVWSCPNPFAATTAIEFALPVRAEIDVRVYDVLGRHVRTLGQGMLDAGPHVVVWDGRDASGSVVPTGIYFCRLRGSGVSACIKLVRLR